MFDYTDPQTFEALGWLMFFVLVLGIGGAGCVLHALHREYKQYVAYRRVHARWREIVEGEDR